MIMKKRFLVSCCIVLSVCSRAQVLFSESFDGYFLNYSSYTVQTSVGINTVSTTYVSVPFGFTLINDGYKNNSGSLAAPNKPFHISALQKEGWALFYNPAINDTFLVSTSWLDTSASVAVKRYVVTPTFSNVTANTVLSWEAMSPDPNYREGYQVLVTTNTSATLSAMDFTSVPLFSLQDGNTSGGGEKTTWTKRGVSLAAYAGQNIRVAFKNISQNMYQLWLDDIKVENVSNTLDAEITTGKPIYKYNKVNTNGTVGCRVTNRGVSTINSFTLNYSVGSGAPQSQAFNVSLTPYAFVDLPMNTPYNISTPGYYKVKLWVSNVNGAPDPNKSNDTLITGITIVSSAPTKSVLAEQFVSAFDGYTPDAQEKLNALAQTTTSLIQVNIHQNDSMTVPAVATLMNEYKPSSSTAFFDRTYFYDLNSLSVDRFSYAGRFAQRSGTVVPVSVSISNLSYNSSTRVVDFTVQANFTGEVVGDYRINAYLTENNVYGPSAVSTLNGWNQLSFMFNAPWSPYYQVGTYDPSANGYILDAFQYKHNSVLDAALDGAYGISGIIPLTGGTDGQTFSRAYSYTVPLAANGEFRFNADNIYVVAFVSEYGTDKNDRSILNCAKQKMTSNSEIVGIKELDLTKIGVYPNPSNGDFIISIPEGSEANSLRIYDVLGKLVYAQDQMSSGAHKLSLPLESGSYVLVLEGAVRSTKKLIITR
jgi:hypothetical protein